MFILLRHNLVNQINFIKNEQVYTKLKYSRVPIYDTVSGGSACLFAGFIGFLVSEKFGFEISDSLDIYIYYFYTIFISLTLFIYYKNLIYNYNIWYNTMYLTKLFISALKKNVYVFEAQNFT